MTGPAARTPHPVQSAQLGHGQAPGPGAAASPGGVWGRGLPAAKSHHRQLKIDTPLPHSCLLPHSGAGSQLAVLGERFLRGRGCSGHQEVPTGPGQRRQWDGAAGDTCVGLAVGQRRWCGADGG